MLVLTAAGASGGGRGRHGPAPGGRNRGHRWFRDWHARLRATERAARAAERRYRERVRAHCAGLPVHRDGDGDDGAALPVAAA